MDYKNLKKKHPKVFRIMKKEQDRQKDVINLIASENYVSPAVLEALGTVFTNKYAEGKAGKRYYFGNKYADELEQYTEELALKLFHCSKERWSVNVQPYSGSPANLAVYAGLLEKGDTVLAMHLDHGGHLTHGHKASVTGKFWKFVHYGVTPEGLLDYDQVERLAKEHRPKLIVCGATAYPRTIDFPRFSKIAQNVSAKLMADVSHIAGLIAGGVHPSPFAHVDVVTTTTHKTLRGPRGALIFARKDVAEVIDKTVFPGLQGGPHLNQIAAIAVALEEASGPDFKKYAQQIVANARALARALAKAGFPVVSGGTDNHLLLVAVTPFGWTGKDAGARLEDAYIIANKNMIPYDTRTPWNPSGLRLGTAAVTTRGMKEAQMAKIGQFISDTLIAKRSVSFIKKEVLKLTKRFKLP